MNRYYLKQWRPGLYHIIDRTNCNLPIYDGAPDGDDSPLVFDEDHAEECLERIQECLE